MSRVIEPTHKMYQRAAKREASTWGRQVEAEMRKHRPMQNPLIVAYHSNLITRQPSSRNWIPWFAKTYGPFEHALSLGSGTGVVEEECLVQGLFRKLDLVDLSENAVRLFEKRIVSRGISVPMNAVIGDLNFLKLEPGKYDLILAHSSLHHLINLEHIFEQVRKALKPEGYFLVHDFIGPSAWQWPKETIDAVNEYIQESKEVHKDLILHPVKQPRREIVKRHSPFESVRSSDILDLIHKGFTVEKEVLTDRLLFVLMNFGIDLLPGSQTSLKRWIIKSIKEEEKHNQQSNLPPCTLWGLYRPGKNALPEGEAWDEQEIRHRIGVPRWDPRGWALTVINQLPWRKRLAVAWMNLKRKRGWY